MSEESACDNLNVTSPGAAGIVLSLVCLTLVYYRWYLHVFAMLKKGCADISYSKI